MARSTGVSDFNNMFLLAFAAAKNVDVEVFSEQRNAAVETIADAISKVDGAFVCGDGSDGNTTVVRKMNYRELQQTLWATKEFQNEVEKAIYNLTCVDTSGIESDCDERYVRVHIPIRIAATVVAA